MSNSDYYKETIPKVTIIRGPGTLCPERQSLFGLMSVGIEGMNNHPKSGIYDSLYDLPWIVVKFPLLPTDSVGDQQQGKSSKHL